MSKGHDNPGERRHAQELLLANLLAAGPTNWPGVDGMTLDEVLRSYPQAARDGLVPDLTTLRQQHPELADILVDFFTD